MRLFLTLVSVIQRKNSLYWNWCCIICRTWQRKPVFSLNNFIEEQFTYVEVCPFERYSLALTGVTQLCCFAKQKVVSLIPCHGSVPVWYIQEATNSCFSLTLVCLSLFPSLPLFLKINK